ncbi:hypothetical protein Patl1_05922 [Pistacia atlantica]|uniref:Uncharacterized protein n=1 Tax=Pistacia atlantica TaxID=434234 RepID=A0ACC1BUH3_9ROSI|nr:hypothetical protein Patl1_05922 [Pistacia atlantica]
MADEKEVLNQQLLGIISSMEEQDLVNPRFRMVHSLKESNGPFFFAELIPTFCSDSRTTIREMIQILEKPVVDFHLLEELCMKIKGASACIGAQQISLASGDLFRAVIDKCKER